MRVATRASSTTPTHAAKHRPRGDAMTVGWAVVEMNQAIGSSEGFTTSHLMDHVIAFVVTEVTLIEEL